MPNDSAPSVSAQTAARQHGAMEFSEPPVDLDVRCASTASGGSVREQLKKRDYRGPV